MTPSENQGATRRDKAPAARAAIVAAKPLLNRRDLISHGLYSDITKRVTEVINKESLSDIQLDERDIILALQALHARGVVVVAHYDSDERPIHSVTFRGK